MPVKNFKTSNLFNTVLFTFKKALVLATESKVGKEIFKIIL